MRVLFVLLFVLFASGLRSFAQEKKVYISSVSFSGNNRTKLPIITRELTFKSGDSLTPSQERAAIEQSRKNLINTALFNFVFIEERYSADSSSLSVFFVLKESWYTWPQPIFELVDRNVAEWYNNGANLSRANYGIFAVQNNCRGRNERLSVSLRAGYTQAVEMSYNIPYINKKQALGTGINLFYGRWHEIPANILASRLVYFKDPNQVVRSQYGGSFKLSYRNGIHEFHTLAAGYKSLTIADSVKAYNADYFYNNLSTIGYGTINYSYRLDYRDYRGYPLNGYQLLVDAIYASNGLSKENLNLGQLQLEYQYFRPIYKPFYFAAGFTGHITAADKQPYFAQQALGYGDNIRGYDNYVVNGQHFVLVNSNIRWAVFQNKIVKVGFIPSEKFNTIPNSIYLNVFYDGGYVADNYYATRNPLANQWLYSYGVGIDYSTYYFSTVRLEYTFNKQQQSGLFLNFKLSIS